MNNYFLSHGPGIRLFNYTATFRRESDYPLTLQWLPSLDYLLTPVAVSLEEKNRLRREGLAPVLYMQSHCDVPSDRNRYVQELMKYIQVYCRDGHFLQRYTLDECKLLDRNYCTCIPVQLQNSWDLVVLLIISADLVSNL